MLKYDKDPIKYPIVYDNKLGITDLDNLLDKEGFLTQSRELEIRVKNLFVKGNFDLSHLQAIHKYLFQDIYPWAGQIRDVNISKDDTLFCMCQYIEGSMADLHNKIKSFDKKSDIKEVANHLAYVSNELNAMHPFREGNGRSKRVFLDRYAQSMGYDLNLQNIPAEELKRLEIEVYQTNNISLLSNRFLMTMQKTQQSIKQECSPALQAMRSGVSKQCLNKGIKHNNDNGFSMG